MKTLITFVSLIFFNFSAFTQTQPQFTAQEIYSKSQEAVVFIYSYDESGTLLCYGSGVIISADGLVYTNFHVIDEAFQIKIKNGDDTYNDIIIAGFSPLDDAAVLKICSDKINCFIKTAGDIPAIGQNVYALGNPRGYTKTLSEGLISGLRESDGITNIQFTASISDGSSGGALLNSSGDLIGITSSTFEKGQNLNFAIPVKYFQNMSLIDCSDTAQVNSARNVFNLYIGLGYYHDYRTYEPVQKYASYLAPTVTTHRVIAEIYSKYALYDSAVNYLTKAIELEPTNKLLYKLRGDAYSTTANIQGSTDSTINDYTKAIELDSNYLEAYNFRGLTYEISLNDYQKAIDDYTKAILLMPDYFFQYTYRANCYLSLGDTLNAINDLTKSFAWEDKNDYSYYKRALLYSSIKNYDEAIADYTTAIKLKSDEPSYYLERAILYSKTGKNMLAADDYRTYMKFYPDSELSYNNLAYCYLGEGEFDTAEKYFNKSLSIAPDHLDSYLGLAILNHRQGKVKKTVGYMYQAIKIEPMLESGINGINELEKKGWFWDKSEKNDMKKIFKLMRIENTEIKISDSKSAKANGADIQ